VLVEAGGDVFDLRRGDEPALPAHHDGLDVHERVLAVEHRDDLEERGRQQHHRIGQAGGITEGDDPLALVLDRKRLHVTEARQRVAHPR
jgi:hypothetical protein